MWSSELQYKQIIYKSSRSTKRFTWLNPFTWKKKTRLKRGEYAATTNQDKKKVEEVIRTEEYREEEAIGKGGFGEVRKLYYYDKTIGKKVVFCVKKIKISDIARLELVKREREILEKATTSKSKNLLKMFTSEENELEVGTEASLYMEYLCCTNLTQFLKKHPRGENLGICKIYFPQICTAAIELHKLGYAHLDIKPDNIRINEKTHSAYLVDYGMVHKINKVENGHILGTPPFWAPEMLVDYQLAVGNAILVASSGSSSSSSQRITESYDTCDFWSLGVTLYYMMNGNLESIGQGSQYLYQIPFYKFPSFVNYIFTDLHAHNAFKFEWTIDHYKPHVVWHTYGYDYLFDSFVAREIKLLNISEKAWTILCKFLLFNVKVRKEQLLKCSKDVDAFVRF